MITLGLPDRISTAGVATMLEELRADIETRFMNRHCLWINEEMSGYVDREKLFGDNVFRKFPSARADITEAGNCLAVGCSTGAVFHLMRAAEIGLRSLAADRQVTFSDASLQSQQIGSLINALDSKIKDLRQDDRKLWVSAEVKDAQIQFYHSAIVEFRGFNEVWRKHMAHAHEGAFYDSLEAMSTLGHVRTCLQTLAAKISETSTTPKYWTQTECDLR